MLAVYAAALAVLVAGCVSKESNPWSVQGTIPFEGSLLYKQ